MQASTDSLNITACPWLYARHGHCYKDVLLHAELFFLCLINILKSIRATIKLCPQYLNSLDLIPTPHPIEYYACPQQRVW